MDINIEKSSITFLIFGIVMIAVSGMVFGLTYFVMDEVQDAFENTNCVISNNAFFDNCQEWFTATLYPFLDAKTILVYLDLIFIIVLIIGMLLSGYNAGNKPYMLGLLLVIEIGLVYGSFWVSNIYRDLLSNEVIRTAMANFSLYNNIMLNLPWFVFIVTLFSLGLGVVNWQRVRRNTPIGDLDY